MTEFITTILQLVLALLMSVQSNTSATVAERQQALSVAGHAMQVVSQALKQPDDTPPSCKVVDCVTPPPGCTYVDGGACVNGYTTCGTLSCPVKVAPRISNLSPTSGYVGTKIVLSGSGFTTSGNTVNFDSSVYTNITAASSDSLTFTIPTTTHSACEDATPRCMIMDALITAGSHNISVTNANGTSNSIVFTVIADSADVSTCLPSGISMDTVVSIDMGGANKITVGQTLKSSGASCKNNSLVDAGGKSIKFYNLTGCWGNPPFNYQQIMDEQNQAIENLQKQYTVITLTCNPSGMAVQ